MTLKDALDAIVNAVSTDAGIAAFCQTNYRQGPFVFRGVNPEDPPGEAFTPCVVVSTGGRGRSGDYHRRLHEIHVACGIVGDKPSVSGNVVSYPGVDLVNEFAELVESVATKALLEADVLSSLPMGDPDQIITSWHLARWTYQVEIENLLA